MRLELASLNHLSTQISVIDSPQFNLWFEDIIALKKK